MPHKLTHVQFDILRTLSEADTELSQRELQSHVNASLGSVNTAVRELEALGYIEERHVTATGINALAPYRVHNAIIMAAGLSSRFAPISYERPKGTLRVRGEILIERQIEQLQEAGINDITVVVGYKKEYFFYLIEKYGVKIIVNKEYSSRNNNGSLWLVREQLSNTYICSSDNYFTENPFEPYVYRAYYSAVYVDGPTNEWCITTGPGGRITGCTIGGENAWTMLGHVYFDSTFSETFRDLLERVYHLPQTAPKLWESLFIENIKDFSMVIRKYPDGIINEFDSVDELQDFDPLFIENVDSEVFDNITNALGCTKTEIRDFSPLKQGLTNLSCHFSVGDSEYVYRHPGIGTDKLIDRTAEKQALLLARDLGLDSTFITADVGKGWKISRYIPEIRNLDVTNDDELQQAMQMIRNLHTSGAVLDRDFDFVQEAMKFEQLLHEIDPSMPQGYLDLRKKVMKLKEYADADGFPTVPSHNDFYPLNFLITPDGQMNLIDWEYAGMSDVAADFGTMVVCSNDIDDERAKLALTYYFGRTPNQTEERHYWAYVVFAGWCWYVWALLKEADGDDVGEWLLTYYEYASQYVDKLLASYEEAAK
ncbi:phosphotransferase [Arcanobacterium phocisimile]|uniref:Phosphotransferase n=1 Tax=Arcanobacterium phocisimile TaxID=1302235 RepID=A0ABX7IHC7_9ACTO|nr:phosphotransferase [Arcanobacterium phocisimile]QRV02245.1 phosphotransferase [Arcanobacterium phocisimile]